MNELTALAIMEQNGIKTYPGGKIVIPKTHIYSQELCDAIDYMCDEFDYYTEQEE